MTKTAVGTPDEPDWEGIFYGIMAQDQAQWQALSLTLRKDTFDAANGPQVGITAKGDIGLLTVFSQEAAKTVMEAWIEYHDHQCEAARIALMGFLYHQMVLMQMVRPAMDQEILDRPSEFRHVEDPDD